MIKVFMFLNNLSTINIPPVVILTGFILEYCCACKWLHVNLLKAAQKKEQLE